MALPLLATMLLGSLLLLWLAFAGPRGSKAQGRRLAELKLRHSGGGPVSMEVQISRVLAQRDTRLDTWFSQFIPNPDLLRKKIAMTGKSWTLGHYAMSVVGLAALITLFGWLRGAPLLLALLFGLMIGLGLPNWLINLLIKRRVTAFTTRFPDAIELLVRGLRSGLPISETIGVVATELPGPVGSEFRAISDKMKIGKTMDQALQETADRLGNPEFQFFVIALAIQRETGGNLTETLSNLADVLRKRQQMKLKIKAMSSESKASAWIIGVLPFLVFGGIMAINPAYMGRFFDDPRLILAGGGGLLWMAIGVMIMRKMINFEI